MPQELRRNHAIYSGRARLIACVSGRAGDTICNSGELADWKKTRRIIAPLASVRIAFCCSRPFAVAPGEQPILRNYNIDLASSLNSTSV